MQRIEKRREPLSLTEWRAANKSDPNFGYGLLAGKPAHDDLKRSLIAEQGGLCAYTGLRIREGTAHVEHLLPQAHCSAAESVDYQNLAACFPGPNAPAVLFGATCKANWPSRDEWPAFVSPLSADCGQRFRFRASGDICPTREDDAAAATTIQKLGLRSPALCRLRQAALRKIGTMSRREARSRLSQVQRETGAFTEFRFAAIQVLEGHLKRLEAIRQQTRQPGKRGS